MAKDKTPTELSREAAGRLAVAALVVCQPVNCRTYADWVGAIDDLLKLVNAYNRRIVEEADSRPPAQFEADPELSHPFPCSGCRHRSGIDGVVYPCSECPNLVRTP